MDRVVHLNAVGARLLGIERDGAEGSRLWELTRAMEVCSILERARREVREVRGETRLLAATPQERVIELWASPLKDREGAVAGSLVVLHDVTQLRKLESLRRDFVANVSHELKTPLTAIRGLVETLLDDPAMESETRRHFLERVRAQAGRLGQLVNDLLTLARVESAEGLPQRERVDVRVVLQECAARFEPLCAAKDLRLVRDLGTRSLIVLGDEECLRQIADNLLDNALKYTPAGGRVHLRARASEATPDVVVEVEDSGIGIPSDQLERIFERFYRVDKARSRELGGTGLGLSIVKNMAQALGGSVSVESALGRGSTFRVTLPLQDV
jgi:two-component system phosphate regulon sensor histidine kinase PhoR